MVCPKCGFGQVAGTACPRCGVVLAKFRPRPGAPSPTPAEPALAGRPRFAASFSSSEPEPPSASRWVRNVVLALGLIGALAGGVAWFVASGRERERATDGATDETGDSGAEGSGPDLSAEVRELTAAPPPPPPPVVSANELRDLSRADHDAVRELVDKLNNSMLKGMEGDTITQADVERAEELAARHPEERRVLEVTEAVLLRWAANRASKQQTAEAIEILRRASALRPESLPPRIALLSHLVAQRDYEAVESEARAALALDSRSRVAHEWLGYALMRLGRDREAMEELQAAIDLGHSPVARSMLEKLRQGQKNEREMKEQAMGYFTLRYEGGEHEAVGNEILRALERHYSTLVSTFDHRPSAPIPVILFTRDGYFKATDAPRWSGGLYDSSDGRIRVPIGGLTTSLSPELDNVLIHELTHAFVADMSHGQAPTGLHEGLAQYMEGKRLAEMLSNAQLARLADGRVAGPARTYLEGLAITEYLIEQRGWGGIKDLLQAMGQDGGGDPYVQVYGQKGEELTRAAQERFQLQHGD